MISETRNADSTLGSVQMPIRMPDIPILRCDACGGDRFIPLTFPAYEGAKEADIRARPTAKCVTCGRPYVPTPVAALVGN